MATKFIHPGTFNLTVLFMIVSFSSCFTAGTHGSLKSYEYTINKYTLQKAVDKVIMNSDNIKCDTTNNYIIDKTNNRNDTIIDNRDNDGETYVTIDIKEENGNSNNYTFQYAGDKNYWDTSMTSSISLAYAYDKDGNGGSEGNGGIGLTLKNKLIKIFEREFLSKVNNELSQKHY
ncbi:MAG: hypothetical protein JWO92_431 [Chitinophagaceae bacterium]|nr:hypothetical protein [Chitinophagaceae bacterium]